MNHGFLWSLVGGFFGLAANLWIIRENENIPLDPDEVVVPGRFVDEIDGRPVARRGVPIIDYVDHHGQAHRFTTKVSRDKYPAGGQTLVAYKRDSPADAREQLRQRRNIVHTRWFAWIFWGGWIAASVWRLLGG